MPQDNDSQDPTIEEQAGIADPNAPTDNEPKPQDESSKDNAIAQATTTAPEALTDEKV